MFFPISSEGIREPLSLDLPAESVSESHSLPEQQQQEELFTLTDCKNTNPVDHFQMTNSFSPLSEQSIYNDVSVQETVSTEVVTSNTPPSKTVNKYSEDLHLLLGFIESPNNPTRPYCLLCKRSFKNEWINASRMKAHLLEKHANYKHKDLSYFQTLKEQLTLKKVQSKKIDVKKSRFEDFLDKSQIADLSRSWIKWDLSIFNIIDCIIGSHIASFNIFCNQDAMLAGYPFIEAILTVLGPVKSNSVSWIHPEGSFLSMSSPLVCAHVATITGPLHQIISVQDTILNVLERCSTIATNVRQLKQSLMNIGWNGQITSSYNYTPGFAPVEQYGSFVGSGYSQKEFFLLKANVLKPAVIGTNTPKLVFINKIKEIIGLETKIKMECEVNQETLILVQAGVVDIAVLKPDRYVTDPAFELMRTIRFAQSIKQFNPDTLVELAIENGDKLITNLIQLNVIPIVIDIISVNSISQNYSPVDFSMKLN